MKTIHAISLLSLAGLGTLIAAPAVAQDDSYFYGGFGVGQSDADIDKQRVSTMIEDTELTVTSLKLDESDIGYKVFGGYQFNRYFGLEAGYFDLGEFGFKAATAPDGTFDGNFKVRGVNLDLVLTMPMGERFAFIARGGAQYAETKDSFQGTGAVTALDSKRSDKATNYKYGVGLQYEFSPSFLMRAEAERYRVSDALGSEGNINLYSVSLVFPFGRRHAEPVAVTQAYTPPPAPAVAPPPAPVPPPPAPAPTRRRVSFSAEALFGFDKSTLRPEGMAALDTFASELRGSQFEVITVEGHTDRMGSEEYNQQLSLERATVVKDYLVSRGGVEAGKVSAVGKGESQPISKAEDCDQRPNRASRIACLQPDRRVEIEVVGSR